ncbi:hypothetical protein JMM81_06945 [Bacillus sp. V3B]|uniref:hypothetical protein n=1 Tax=Bacillus sp. V3B TaxID=2804915 RepID=UPI00210D1027|nr:hypothetical protein [Bacillus sp. V3B]MCQ6274708.1 hypothetical protein [Bacillus sp. V3B]
MSTKTIRRVKLIKEQQYLGMLELSVDESEYALSVTGDINEHIKKITQCLKQNNDYEDKLAFWDDLIQELKSEEINVVEAEAPIKERVFSMHFDIEGGEMMATQTDATTHHYVSDDIGRSIANRISKVFSEFGTECVAEIEVALSEENWEGAFSLLNKGMLHLASKQTKMSLFSLLQSLPPSALDASKRKRFYEIKFLLGESTGRFDLVFDDASHYLEEFCTEAEPRLIQNILLLKANAAAKLGKRELAYSMYQEIIKKSFDDYGTLAWAYRGLAIILGNDNPDAGYHEMRAADAFLVDGNKKEFVTSKISLSNRFQNSNPEQAIGVLEEAIGVLSEVDLREREWLARLALNKAQIYHTCGQHEAAVEEAERSIALRGKDAMIGNEAARIASLNSALLFSEHIEVDDSRRATYDKYEAMIGELENGMLDKDQPSYLLRKNLSQALVDKDVGLLKELETDVMEERDVDIRASYWISRVLAKTDATFLEKLELTEKAWSEASAGKASYDLKAAICSLFADLYLEHQDTDKALHWYQESLYYNPFLWHCRQNYLALLWEDERWDDAVKFLESQRERFGDLPSLLFTYGKSLVEAGRSGEALPILWQAQKKSPEATYIRTYINKAMDNFDGTVVTPEETGEAVVPSEGVTLTALEECLKDFVKFVSQDKRMSFWRNDPKQKGHKWVKFPEQHGQNLLHTFIKSRFGSRVEAIEEVDTGAGRIDIYLRFENGLKTIIELKLCGGGYSKDYAVSGIEQLTHYLENKQTHLGYLLIFDGRMRDCGKGIDATYPYQNYTIRSFVADIHPKVK